MKPSSNTTAHSPTLNIVVALACEARPLIDQYRLKKISQLRVLTVYTNQAQSIHLVVAGIGKIQAAVATTYLHAIAGSKAHACFLNVGIAGSGGHSLGSAVLAHKITEHTTGRVVYPTLSPNFRGVSETLVCYDQPQQNYGPHLMDMESAGFFQAAALLIGHDQIQVMKVISDTPEQDTSKIKSEQVIAWVKNQMETIDSLVQCQLALSAAEAQQVFDERHFLAMVANWHFTQYQRHQLTDVLRRWPVVMGDQDPLWVVRECRLATEVIENLASALRHAPYLFE